VFLVERVEVPVDEMSGIPAALRSPQLPPHIPYYHPEHAEHINTGYEVTHDLLQHLDIRGSIHTP